jgi:oligopeptide/dipeptide ABC transporter ATP-binding protein
VILRRGRVVELGATGRVFDNPLHPYTRRLLASAPQLHRRWGRAAAELELRDAALHRGCVYHERFPDAGREGPALATAEDDHLVACFRLDGEGR